MGNSTIQSSAFNYSKQSVAKSKIPYLAIGSNMLSDSPQSAVYTITPEIAETLLQLNTFNRKITPDIVKRYAQSMRDGEWCVADAITFDREGRLLNGQHRLKAVIAANMDIQFLVTKGLPNEAKRYYDLGKKRTAEDISIIDGNHISRLKISVVRAMFLSRQEERHTSAHKILKLYEKYQEGIDFSTTDFSDNGNKTLFRTAVFRAPIAKAFYYENHQRLHEFLKILDTGIPISGNGNEDNAAFALREHFMRQDKSARRGQRQMWYRRAENALKHFCDRKPISISRYTEVTHYPLPYFDSMSVVNMKIFQRSYYYDDLKTPI